MDSEVHKSLVCMLEAEEWMAIECSFVFLFFVGDEDEREGALGHAFLGEAIEELSE